jgi:hypothetical protein
MPPRDQLVFGRFSSKSKLSQMPKHRRWSVKVAVLLPPHIELLSLIGLGFHVPRDVGGAPIDQIGRRSLSGCAKEAGRHPTIDPALPIQPSVSTSPHNGSDEPGTFRYANPSIRPTGADVRHLCFRHPMVFVVAAQPVRGDICRERETGRPSDVGSAGRSRLSNPKPHSLHKLRGSDADAKITQVWMFRYRKCNSDP